MKSKTPLYIGIGAIAAALIAAAIIFIPKLSSNNGETGSSNGSQSQTEQTTTGITGKWKYYDSAYGDLGSDYIYTFNADGTGQYDAAGTIMPFTYTIDGDSLAILYEGSTDPFESTFSIDSDTLNIKDSLGSDTLYKKM